MREERRRVRAGRQHPRRRSPARHDHGPHPGPGTLCAGALEQRPHGAHAVVDAP